MAKKKKYKKYDSFSEFAPGGNAVAEWEAGRRNAQTRGHTQEGSGARFNTPLQEERYKPIEKSTYQSYLARQFSNNPNKIRVSSSAFKSYTGAKAALETIKPGLSKGLMSESAYSNQYQTDVDKAYRLKYMQDDLIKLDPTTAQKNVADSFFDTKAIKRAKQQHQTATDLMKKAQDYKKLYGDNKEVDVIFNAAKTYDDFFKNAGYNKDEKAVTANNAKTKLKIDDDTYLIIADSAFRNRGNTYDAGSYIVPASFFPKDKRPAFGGEKIEPTKGQTLSAPHGKDRTPGYVRNAKARGNSYTFDDFRDAKGVGATVTEKKGMFKLSKKDMIELLQDKGLSKDEAKAFLKSAKDYGIKRQQKEAYEAGKAAGENMNVADKLVKEIGESITTVPRAILGFTGATKTLAPQYEELKKASDVGFEETKKKGMNEAQSFAYDVASFAGQLAANTAVYGGLGSLGGGASTASKIGSAAVKATPFAAEAAQSSYNHALDNGASKDQAKLYGATTGLLSEILFSVGVGKISKIAKGAGGGLIEGAAKKIVAGEAVPGLGKAILSTIGKGAVEGGKNFAEITAINKAADLVSQSAILAEKSDYKKIFNSYKSKGLSTQEAWKKTATDIGIETGKELLREGAKGAIIGAGGAALGSIRQAPEYGRLKSEAETLRPEYERYTSDKSSPYFENVDTPEELQRQYRQQAKELHSDEGGSDEAFRSLSAEKERLHGILTEDYSLDAQKAIDNWENFVNKSRDILGLERELTTKEKQQWKDDFANVRDNLLETKLKVEGTRAQTPEEAVEIQDVAQTIDNEIAKADNVLADLNEPISLPEELPTVKEVNIDNLSDRQAEVANKGTEYDLPEKAIKTMLANDSESVSPEEYAIGFNQFYIMGKDSGTESISDAISKVPELREVADRITPQAAGVAFDEGKSEVKIRNIDTTLKAKPSGKFMAETPARTMNEKYVHGVIENMAKLGGANIGLVKDMTNLNVPKNTQGVSFTDKGNIAIQEDVANILGVVSHEYYHLSKKLNTEGAKIFEDVVKDIARKDLGIRGFDKNVKDLVTEYGRAGQTITYDEAQEEAIAYLAETMLLNPDIREKVIKGITESSTSEAQKKHIIQTILEWIQNAIKAVTERVKNARVRRGTESVLKEDLVDSDKAAKAVIDMLKDTKKAFEKADVSNTKTDKTKFSVTDETKVNEDVIRNNFKYVAEMKPVKKITENVLNNYDGLLDKQIEQYFSSVGEKTFSNYGEVSLGVKSAKAISAKTHGFNKIKAWGISGIKETLENGKAIFYKKNYPSNGKDRLTIAAPVSIVKGDHKGNYMLGISIDVSPTTNKATMIEMALEKENLMDATIGKKMPTHGKGFPSILTLLQQVIDVKNGKLDLKDVSATGIDSVVKVDSEGRKLTAQQQSYFKDSKVRDEDGNLQVVYHGTPDGNFSVFDNSLSFSDNVVNSGFWFSNSKELVEKYYAVDAWQNNKEVKEVYLNIKNPLVVDAKNNDWNKIPADKKISENFKYENALTHKTVTPNTISTDNYAEYAKNNGYDGVIFSNIREGKVGEKPSTSYVVFNSNQIKNIDNTSPTENEDIRYSLLSKDAYEAKAKYAENKARNNEKIALENGMTQEQVDVIDDITRLRHDLHSTDSASIFNDQVEDPDSYNYFFDDIAEENYVNTQLKKVGLPELKLPSWDTHFTEWDFDEEVKERGIEKFSKEWEELRSEYLSNLTEDLEKANTAIENWLGAIDKKYGTQYKPTGKSRIFSLTEKEAQDEISKFEEVREDIGRQFKILPGSKLDNKQTRQLALETKKKLDSDIDTYELSYQLKALGALIESKNGNIDNTDVQDKAKQIIRDAMKNAKYVNDETQDVLRYIRGTKLQATDQIKTDIPDYNEFRKANFGSINLTNDGAPVDTWIVEAAGIHPYPFSEWVELAPSDIVKELADWVASAKEGNYTMYDMGGEDAVDFYALELLNDYADAKVEDITNSKAKQRELYENIDKLVGFAKEKAEEVGKAKEDTRYQVNKAIENYKKNSGEIKLKLDEQKRELQDKFSKAMEEEIAKVKGEASEKQKKAIARIKANQKARNKKLKEQSERTHERQQIRKSRDRLYKVITNPKTHKYMDVELKKPVEDLIKAIDLGEQYTIQRLNTMRDNAYIRYTGEELQDKLKKIDETEFKFNNTYNSVLDALKQRVADSVDDSSTYYAPVISLMENAIEKAHGVSLMKMDIDQLKAVKNSLRALEKAVIERNRPVTIKLKNNNKPVETYEEAAKLAVKQLESTDLSKFMKAISSHFTGSNIFLATGGGNPNSITAQFAKKFDDAYLKEAEIQKTLHDIIDPVMNEKAGKTRYTTKAEQLQGYKLKDLMDVGLKDKYGKPILINKANAIDLYLDLLDSDHLRHIARGGTTIPDYKKQYTNRPIKEVYGNGSSRTGNVDAEITDIENKIKRAYESEDYDTIRELVDNKTTIIKARENDLKKIRDNIKNSLTDYDKKVIKAYRDIVKETTELANEEWLHTFGFENFTEDDNTYKHIMSDPNFVKGNDSGNKQELITNLSESGITQARVEGAGNPVLSGDIFFNIEDYINTMAKTIAYAGLQRDLNAVMKYKLPGYENVQSSLQHKYPKMAEELHTLQQDLFGGRSHSDGKGKRVISTLRGLSVRSVLSPNLRVALAQIPSYLGTYRYTDGKAIKNAWLPKNRVKQDTIHKYTPLMWVRGAKGFSLETQDLQNANNKLLKTLDKVDRLTNGWIYKIPLKVDAWTVRHTFGAYLDYARRMYPKLEEGTKEQIANGESPLYKKAAELFNEGTMRTQPMFNTLNRNAWQRSDNEIAKTLTLFHTQPFQYLNLLIKDNMEYNWAKKNGADTSKVKSARQKLFKTIAAVTAAQILFNVMKELVDKTIRHKDDSTPEDIAEKIVSSFANMFVLGSTITDGLYDLITKGNINDFEIYGTGTINDIQDFAEQTARVFEGKSVDYKKQTLKILNGLGIPAQNIEKDLGGIWRNIEDFIDNGARDFSNEKTEQELYQDYAKGNYSQEDLKELGYEFGEENKQKIANAIKKVYLEGEIDEAKAVEKLKDTKLFKPTSESEPLTTFLEGKVAMWKINSYKEKYQDSLTDNGAEKKESRKIRQEINKLNWRSAFWSNPANISHKNYKSSQQKLEDMFKKWREG